MRQSKRKLLVDRADIVARSEYILHTWSAIHIRINTKKKWFYVHKKFKSLSQMKGSSINDYYIFKVHSFRYGRPQYLFDPGV